MSWKVLNLENKSELRVENNQLAITQEGITTCVPFDNLCAIIFATKQITLTSSVLVRASEVGVTIITTNDKHLPNGVLIGFHQHSRQSEITQIQSNMGVPLKKQTWQVLIKQKILNQAIALKPYASEQALAINKMVSKVRSGDPDNIEAIAAKLYWTKIFYPGFVRHQGCVVNMALNYTYAIVRAMISKAIAASGLIPSLGVHHRNALNAFNLSDDLIEPFRPIIDLYVRKKLPSLSNVSGDLSQGLRKELLGIGFAKCIINGKVYEIATAIQEVCDSFVRVLRHQDAKLMFVPSHKLEPSS